MEGDNWSLSGTATLTGTTADTFSLNSGKFVLTGTVNQIGAGGGTTIAPGATLELGSNTASGFVNGEIVNNGTLVFNRSDSLTYHNVITGAGSLTQAGAGSLILTADQTYTGGTTISNGTLQLGNGGATGNIVGNIASVWFTT
jgi:autotransporter-associated beta strand protein